MFYVSYHKTHNKFKQIGGPKVIMNYTKLSKQNLIKLLIKLQNVSVIPYG